MRFADVAGLDEAARALGDLPRDRDTLTLRVPSAGTVEEVKALLDRFTDRSIAVETLSIHTPDLDDVFFALTGVTTP